MAPAPRALAPPAPVPAAPSAPRPEREQLLRAALAFVDALLHSDATALAAASADRFSFDGALTVGRENQVRRWREIFAARAAGDAVLRDLVLLDAEEALAQLGAPPTRIAPLVKPGAWVAVADVSGRPVVLVLVRDGGRFTVAGMHD